MSTKSHIQRLLDRKPSTEHFQKIISALRGPDWIRQDGNGFVPCSLDALKELTTARIRAIVAPDYYGSVNHKPLTKEQQYTRDNWLHYAPKHFRSHYVEACYAIRKVYGYNLIKEQPSCEEKTDTIHSLDTTQDRQDF